MHRIEYAAEVPQRRDSVTLLGGIRQYHRAMPGSDLDALPPDVRAAARVEPNGEVCWALSHVTIALDALARANRVVLGLDVRDYNDDGTFIENAWSVFEPTGAPNDPEIARQQAQSALMRPDLPGDVIVVTWSVPS